MTPDLVAEYLRVLRDGGVMSATITLPDQGTLSVNLEPVVPQVATGPGEWKATGPGWQPEVGRLDDPDQFTVVGFSDAP
jgi:hypothetical protein